MKKNSLYALLLLIIAMFSGQGSGSLAKVLFQNFPVLTVAAMRLFFSVIILAFIFRIWTINFRKIRWKAIFSYGLALAGMNALFYLSLERLPLGLAVAFEFTGPLCIALYYIRKKYDFLWVACAILGLILLLPLNQTTSDLDLIGVLFGIGAGGCWAIYILAGQKESGISGNHTVCLGMSIGMFCLLPFAFFSGAMSRVIELPNLYYFIGLAVLASALPFSLEMVALRRLTSRSFGTLMSLEPAIAALSGFIFLGETLLWTQWLALVAIIIASIGCTFTVQQYK